MLTNLAFYASIGLLYFITELLVTVLDTEYSASGK